MMISRLLLSLGMCVPLLGADNSRAASRSGLAPDGWSNDFGFRCARSGVKTDDLILFTKS